MPVGPRNSQQALLDVADGVAAREQGAAELEQERLEIGAGSRFAARAQAIPQVPAVRGLCLRQRFPRSARGGAVSAGELGAQSLAPLDRVTRTQAASAPPW